MAGVANARVTVPTAPYIFRQIPVCIGPFDEDTCRSLGLDYQANLRNWTFPDASALIGEADYINPKDLGIMKTAVQQSLDICLTGIERALSKGANQDDCEALQAMVTAEHYTLLDTLDAVKHFLALSMHKSDTPGKLQAFGVIPGISGSHQFNVRPAHLVDVPHYVHCEFRTPLADSIALGEPNLRLAYRLTGCPYAKELLRRFYRVEDPLQRSSRLLQPAIVMHPTLGEYYTECYSRTLRAYGIHPTLTGPMFDTYTMIKVGFGAQARHRSNYLNLCNLFGQPPAELLPPIRLPPKAQAKMEAANRTPPPSPVASTEATMSEAPARAATPHPAANHRPSPKCTRAIQALINMEAAADTLATMGAAKRQAPQLPTQAPGKRVQITPTSEDMDTA